MPFTSHALRTAISWIPRKRLPESFCRAVLRQSTATHPLACCGVSIERSSSGLRPGYQRRHVASICRTKASNLCGTPPSRGMLLSRVTLATNDGVMILSASRTGSRRCDDDIVYSAPNFVSEYRRNAVPVIPAQQWHLDNTGYYPGQIVGQDVRAKEGWAIAMGNASIVVAVLDDGVDIDHPALADHIWHNPDPSSQDKCGRDYTSAPSSRASTIHAPRLSMLPTPILLKTTFTERHAQASLPRMRLMHAPTAWPWAVESFPVKIFNGSSLTPDETVANAIQYAASIADILSCSWDCPAHPATQDAITAAATNGRHGKGCAVFCSVGNSGADTVAFPADLVVSIAVGSSTGDGSHAPYSNGGAEIAVVAPSGDSLTNVFTCDVSVPNMGFNPGDELLGGADGLYTNGFSGTSASVPIAAGVAAVLLSAYPNLTGAQMKTILEQSADKIGTGYDATGHSDLFGYGKVNLAAALNAAAKY